MGLAFGRWRNLLEIVIADRPRATPGHLLEIVGGAHVAHEQQTFERPNISACRDHVDCDRDAGVVGVAEVGERRLWVFLGLVCDLFAEVVPFAEFGAHNLNDVVGVAVGLGKYQGLGHFLSVGEDIFQIVAKGADHRANLIRVDDRPVELVRAVGLVLVLLLPAFGARLPLPLFKPLLRLQIAAGARDLRVDQVDFVADVDAVGDRHFARVFADHILLEKAVGAIVRGCCEANEEAVEIFDHLSLKIVDRAVAFVDNDDVEEFGR